MYEYECPVHGRFDTLIRADSVPCPATMLLGTEPCPNPARRVWHVNRKRGIQPHFNQALGCVVKSDRDFDEKLKIAGEAAGSTFSRIDPGDSPRPSTDDEVFDTQMRTLTDKGFVDGRGNVPLDDRGGFIPQ